MSMWCFESWLLAAVASACFFPAAAAGQESGATRIRITVTAGEDGLRDAPVRVPLSISKEFSQAKVTKLTGDGYFIVGQLTTPGLAAELVSAPAKDQMHRDLHFIVPELKAGASLNLTLDLPASPHRPNTSLLWDHGAENWSEVRVGDVKTKERAPRPVLRYMHAPYDDRTKDSRDRSYKVFHHLYDTEGSRFVTNGGHTDPFDDEKKLLFPHHRGLMFGFNRITYGKNRKADTWHCPKEYIAHAKTLSEEAGPVLARHRVLLDWVGPDKHVFAKEERELTVYNVSGGTMVDFASLLKTTGGKVKLDGDPQHAGFQFRAANEVAEKTAKQTYYLRPDGKGELGETRNWDPKTKKGPINLPWNAMSFVLGAKRYTVAYLDHPKNPGERRWSERDYGRFGCYFEYELTEENPLLVRYRVWLQNGEMKREQVEALRRAFVDLPSVAVK